MQVIATNIGERKTVSWNGEELETGIFKYPVAGPLSLGSEDVVNDNVVDRQYHGGVDKACYLYSKDHYPHWKTLYPDLDWDWGQFGENLTVAGLDETELFIGDIYQVGNAVVQVSQPRVPCFKLGIRFDTQKILKPFLQSTFSGAYVRVLTPGTVQKGDTFVLQERQPDALSVSQVYGLLSAKEPDQALLRKAIDDVNLSAEFKPALVLRVR